MTAESGLLRVRSVQVLAAMRNVVLKRSAAGDTTAPQILKELQSLNRRAGSAEWNEHYLPCPAALGAAEPTNGMEV